MIISRQTASSRTTRLPSGSVVWAVIVLPTPGGPDRRSVLLGATPARRRRSASWRSRTSRWSVWWVCSSRIGGVACGGSSISSNPVGSSASVRLLGPIGCGTGARNGCTTGSIVASSPPMYSREEGRSGPSRPSRSKFRVRWRSERMLPCSARRTMSRTAASSGVASDGFRRGWAAGTLKSSVSWIYRTILCRGAPVPGLACPYSEKLCHCGRPRFLQISVTLKHQAQPICVAALLILLAAVLAIHEHGGAAPPGAPR